MVAKFGIAIFHSSSTDCRLSLLGCEFIDVAFCSEKVRLVNALLRSKRRQRFANDGRGKLCKASGRLKTTSLIQPLSGLSGRLSQRDRPVE